MNRTLGEWVESLIDKDENIKSIVNQYTIGIDPCIRLANVINIMDVDKQNELKNRIEHYINGDDKKEEINPRPKVELRSNNDTKDATKELEEHLPGKNIFVSFLRAITSLGNKNIEPDWDNTPKNFLIYYRTSALQPRAVRDIFNRFKSLYKYTNNDIIKINDDNVKLYFGIKIDCSMEYGFKQKSEYTRIGTFKINQSTLEFLQNIDASSLKSLKSIIINLDINKLKLFCSIKNDMNNFDPGYNETKKIINIHDDVISFGYYGIGKWNYSNLNDDELIIFKQKLNDFVFSTRWFDKVLINVVSSNYYVYFNIKIK